MIWDYHDTKLKELQNIYDKFSRQKQNDLQALFNSIDKTNIYDIADNKTKNSINTYIEKWKDDGLLTGIFGAYALNIYKRTRVNYNDLIQLMIYGIYEEEQYKIDKPEQAVFKDDANYYFQQGQKEVTNNKPSIITDTIFFELLREQNFSGLNWYDYIQTTIQYNTNQLYKQVLINIQQQKPLKIDSDEFKRIINMQNRQKLNFTNNKVTGATDLELIGLNNRAKIEGIKSINDNAKVRFLAVTDQNSTPMCQSMDNMEFYIDKENKFQRYWGESAKEVTMMPVSVKGLVPGINLPPILHYFHWCRSTITYIEGSD